MYFSSQDPPEEPGIVEGQVVRVDPSVQNGTVKVDISLSGDLPKGARPDLSVEGVVELERLTDVIFVGRPAYGQERGKVGLFKLSPDGSEATRVTVDLGRSELALIPAQQELVVPTAHFSAERLR